MPDSPISAAMPPVAAKALALAGLLAAGSLPAAEASLLRRSGVGGPLDTPDLTAYDPVEVLCTRSPGGVKKVQGWCKTWVACIKKGATPAGDAAAVRAAWKPADCKEVCGAWPVTSKPEGKQKNASALLATWSAGGRGNRTSQDAKDCEKSCGNFQDSLTKCVAMILFEPGKVAAMGAPSGKAPPKPPAHCSSKGTSCLPELPINYQKCMAREDDPTKKCKTLKTAMEDCKDCPALSENFLSHYHAFVGGCMDQLNAYHQATHPDAAAAAIPGAAGCKVH